MSNAAQLYLLADHLKLSLLERQRAQSLKLPTSSTSEANISRSLDALRTGVNELRATSPDSPDLKKLQTQLATLDAQYAGSDAVTSPETLKPNDHALDQDFQDATTLPNGDSITTESNKTSRITKSVRFDSPSSNARKITPYHDDPTTPTYSDNPEPDPSNLVDQSQLDNQQIHMYHKQVIQDQDEQLDRLGESISRTRDLSIQIGSELEEQIGILDEVDEATDRHQGTLDGARKRLDTFSRKAKEGGLWTVIAILVVILLVLVIVLK